MPYQTYSFMKCELNILILILLLSLCTAWKEVVLLTFWRCMLHPSYVVQAPASTLPPVSLLDQNLYIHEHSLTLLTPALKLRQHVPPEHQQTQPVSTPCRNQEQNQHEQ
jgi:hypothetical protein